MSNQPSRQQRRKAEREATKQERKAQGLTNTQIDGVMTFTNNTIERVRQEANAEIERVKRNAALCLAVEYEHSRFERAVLAISLIAHKETGQRRIEELKRAGEEFGKVYNGFMYALIESEYMLNEPVKTFDQAKQVYKEWQNAIASLLAGDNGEAIEAIAADYLSGSVFLERRDFGGRQPQIISEDTKFIVDRARDLRASHPQVEDARIVNMIISEIDNIPKSERTILQDKAYKRLMCWKSDTRGKVLSKLLGRLF